MVALRWSRRDAFVRVARETGGATPQGNRLSRLHARYLTQQHEHRRLVLALQLVYAALFSAWLAYSHTWPAPDLIAVFLLLFALFMARGLRFLRDWTPFVLLLLGYIALTGLVGGLTARAHVAFPIVADRRLFGGLVPTVWLQTHLYNPDHLRWYDYVSTLLYPMHFVVPLVIAFVFWMWRPQAYWRFVASYLVLCYAGFITYVVYPMAPPWWAYRVGQLPVVHLIRDEVKIGGIANPVTLATRYFHPNPVAAMPSLHAGFPLLVWLVLWRTWPRWGWAVVVYPLAMSFAVVYTGEHYVVDCLAGYVYALVAFVLVWGVRSASRPAPAMQHASRHRGALVPAPAAGRRTIAPGATLRRA
jgi:hypothetical protein